MSSLVETMMYVGQTPWHGDGTKLTAPPTSQEAIIQAGLDWSVEALPLYADAVVYTEPHRLITSSTEKQKVGEGQVVRRCSDGSILGVVGPRWTPVQNRDAFGFFDPLVQQGLAVYHTAGSLKDGKTIWILAQIGENRTIVGDDSIGQFLLLSMGHDGKRSVQIQPTPIRVVCANTLNMADLGAEAVKAMLKVQHTRNAVTKLAEIGDFIKPFLASYDETVEVFQILARAQVDARKVDEYLTALFPDPTREGVSNSFARNVRRQIMNKFEGQLLGYDAIPERFKRTYWTLYNAVTEYVDHDRGTDAHRMNSAWNGSGTQLKAKALELAQV